jgi:ABC-type phosphate/phosphonate transport system permease subunit
LKFVDIHLYKIKMNIFQYATFGCVYFFGSFIGLSLSKSKEISNGKTSFIIVICIIGIQVTVGAIISYFKKKNAAK